MKADHVQVSVALKTARGHIDGILRMVEEDRYCMDVSHQLMAVEAILRNTNKVVLKAHLEQCVRDAVLSGSGLDAKIEEILRLLERLMQ